MGKGRKSKPGARTKSGALKRNNYPQPVYDRGSDRIKAQRDKYGENYNSPIGRAYAGGLLGDEATAMNRLQGGKRFARVYGSLIEQGRYGCPLGRELRLAGSTSEVTGMEACMRTQEWLFEAMRDLDAEQMRPWLDQMLASEYHDQGPVWLDRLLMGGRDPYDRAMLNNAIKALDTIAPPMPVNRIRAA